MQIIKHQSIVEDHWQRFTGNAGDVLPEGDLIVPLAYWLEHKPALASRAVGVCIASDVDIYEVAEDIVGLELIALDFPLFSDGRHYSNARLLRERYDFKGELRALGNVLRDQLLFMQRCGIDSFQLQEGKDLKDALNAFSELSMRYQTATDAVDPVYKKR